MQLDQKLCEVIKSLKKFQDAKLLQIKQTGVVLGLQLVPSQKGNPYHWQSVVNLAR